MRFFLDQNVDARVGGMLRSHGHECWSADQAGLSLEQDDSLTVYADEQKAVLITDDAEFSRRRKRNLIGMHLWLRAGRDSVAVLEQHLDEVVEHFRRGGDILLEVSRSQVKSFRRGWE